jgi:hypothetical protein
MWQNKARNRNGSNAPDLRFPSEAGEVRAFVSSPEMTTEHTGSLRSGPVQAPRIIKGTIDGLELNRTEVRRPKMKRITKIALGALALAGAATVAAAPADARVYVGVGVGPGYYGGYYAPGYCNPYYYNCGYYGPGYYGYGPSVSFGFGGYRGGYGYRGGFGGGFHGGGGHGGGHR